MPQLTHHAAFALLLTLALSTMACRTAQPDVAEPNLTTPELPPDQHIDEPPQVEPAAALGPQVHAPHPDDAVFEGQHLEPRDCRTTGCDGSGECVPRAELDCTSNAERKKRGRCSIIQRDGQYEYGDYLCTNWLDEVCGAIRDEDCLQSAACKEEGFCQAGSYRSEYNKCHTEDGEGCFEIVANACMASASGCMASTKCETHGECGVQARHWGKTCRPMEEAHCQQADICRDFGRCGIVFESGSWCAPTLDAHCQESTGCREYGACNKPIHDMYCIIKNDADCEQADVCKAEGKCFAKSGRCVTAAEAQR